MTSTPSTKKKLVFSLPFAVPSRNMVDKMHWAKRQKYRNFIHLCVFDALCLRREAIGTLATSKPKQQWIPLLRLEFCKVTGSKRYLSLYGKGAGVKRGTKKEQSSS